MSPGAAGAARPRVPESDLLRIVALVGVAMIHATAWAPGGGGNSDTVFGAISDVSRFSVPVFMVLTGFALGYQYGERPLGRAFAARRIARTIVPWLIWAPIYLLFDIYIATSVGHDPRSVWSWVLQGAGHLWYLLLVPQMYLLFSVWPRRRALVVVLPALALQTLLCVARVYGLFPGGAQPFALSYAFEVFPFWIGYFAIGVALGRAPVGLAAVAPRGLLTLAALAAAIAGGYLLLNVKYAGARWASWVQGTGAFQDPVLPLLVFGIFALVWLGSGPLLRRSPAAGRAVRALSDLSLGVYIIHPIPLYFFGLLWRDALNRGTPFAFVPFSAVTLAALVCAAVVTRLIVATPLAYAVGARPAPLHLGRLLPAGWRATAHVR